MKRKKTNGNARKTLLIVTASEAESLYFSQMRKDWRYAKMTIMWGLGGRDPRGTDQACGP